MFLTAVQFSTGPLLALNLLVGCAVRNEAALKARSTAVVQVQQEPDSLNPYLSVMNSTTAISTLFYSGLVLLNDRSEWEPDLVIRVPTLANGDVTLHNGKMQVVYHLRSGVKWHDGTPLTASDVVGTYRLVTNAAFPAVTRAGYDLIHSITARDAVTVVVEFSKPYAPYLELFPFVLPAHKVLNQAHPDREVWNREPVGSGPYKFFRWVSGDRLVAEANAQYFRGAPAIDRLELRFINQDITAFNLWRSGELDLFQGASPTQFDYLQREAPDRLFQTPAPSWEHLVFNLDNAILGDVRVRRAIAHLIDREQLNTVAYGGVFQPSWSEVPSGSWAYPAGVERSYPYDPEIAGKLLEEAGWHAGGQGIRTRNGRRLSLTLLTTSDRASRQLAGQLWRRQWKDAGVELKLEKRPASEIFGSAATGGRLAKGTFDLALIASLSRPDPDSSFRWRSDQIPPSGQNRSRYRNPVADRLLDEGLRTISPQKRKAIYAQLEKQLTLDLPVIPLLYWVGVDATSQRLVGYRPNPTLRGNLWNVWEWKLKPN